MAFSYVERSGDGSTTTFTFNFSGQDEGYINGSDIEVTVDGSSVDFIQPSTNSVEITPAPAAGTNNILIRRVMPKDRTYADFRTGNNFGQEILNNSFLQSLYIIQELLDGWFPEGFSFQTPVKFGYNIKMNGNDIVGVNKLEAVDATFEDFSLKDRNETATDLLNEAYDWAQYPHNQTVPEGNGTDEYSAYHYSVESEGHMDAAALSESTAVDKAAEAGQSATNSASSATESKGYRDQSRTAKNAAQAAKSDAAGSATDAAGYRDKAEKWAEEPEGSTVEVGKYSAKHYAAKSSDSATASSNSADSASASETRAGQHEAAAQGYKNDASTSASAASTSETNAASSESNAESYKNTAMNYRDKAQAWANESEDVTVEPGQYSAKHWSKKAEGFAQDANSAVYDGIREGKKNTSPSEDAVFKEFDALGSAATKDESYFVRAGEGIPKGVIAMWSGAENDVPTGWGLCDGTQGTPDLTDRFVLGKGSYNIGDTGGEHSVTLTQSNLPPHKHSVSISSSGNHRHGGSTSAEGQHSHSLMGSSSLRSNEGLNHPNSAIAGWSLRNENSEYYQRTGYKNKPFVQASGNHTHSFDTDYQGQHTHSASVGNTGGGESFSNLPPYMVLAYIMKL